tara:strand:+ start:185 stop:325 length:141 start_codon:yes stop_codon:yes gene_type:complete
MSGDEESQLRIDMSIEEKKILSDKAKKLGLTIEEYVIQILSRHCSY